MIPRLKDTLLIAVIIAVATAGNLGAAKKQSFEKLSGQILETLQSFYPVRSTLMGIHAYDHRFTDYSSKAVKNMVKSLNSFEKKLYKYKGSTLSSHNLVNYKLLKSNVDIALLDLKKIAWHKKSPRLYADEAIDGIYSLVISQHAPMDEKVVSIVSRMKAIPALFTTARKNIKNPPPVYIRAATSTLEEAIAFYREVAGELMSRFPERADNILKVSTLARESMSDFVTYLSEIKPGVETSFAIGKENFNYKLSNEYFLPFDSDSLLAIGETLLNKAVDDYHTYEEYVETSHQNGSDSVFIPANFSRQDILDYYDWETDQIKIFLRNNKIVSIPENIAPVEVVETPSYLRSMISGIAYQPAGPFDSLQTGYFYVRPVPKDLDRRQLEGRYRYVNRRGFKGSAVHEAFPGHHLQMQIAGAHADPVRKWQGNNMLIEGWALYCEEMMYHSGLFGKEDPAQWLGVLGGIRFRAARIVADVKLHTGQFTYDECVAWMNEVLEIKTESGRDYINREVTKYTLRPTYQMSYLMGKREVMNLREAMENRDGASFSLLDFHDALLAEGSIPPTFMWKIWGLE